jgi:cell pole-organizing protein PopZ
MDEILASIRKIIENNEAQPDLAEDAQDDEGFHITTESHVSLLDHPGVVERFHAEEHRSVQAQPVQRAEPVLGGQPALSLADVAARVRAASERHVAANREAAEREPEPMQAATREESPFGMARPAAPTVRFEPAFEPVQAVQPAVEEVAAVRSEPARDVEVSAAAPEPLGRDLAALLSPAVGERVAQSFGALAQAVDSGPRRSFDEIAEEMLRPMLQEWLDDNLPTLVERLVREEIERVARGPRR